MVSRPKKKNASVTNQMIFDLFQGLSERLPVEGGSQENLSDFEFGLTRLLKTVLEEASIDRFEVAARMSRKLGREITKNTIDQWTAMSAVQKRINVDALKALCEVTGDWRLLHFFVESCGFTALEPEEAVYAEYGAKMMMKRMIDDDIKETLSKADGGILRQRMIKRIKG